jgi:hypothetical protein
MTAVLERPVTLPLGMHTRPVHIPDPRNEWVALCGADLTGTSWVTREPNCPDCLVRNELFDLSGAGGLEDDPDA